MSDLDVGVVTDSISSLPKGLVEKYGIEIVPISIYFQNKIYRDWIDLTPSQAYELFLKDPESFATSPASPTSYFEAYYKLSKKVNNIICITLSAKVSTGYEMALVAKKKACEELPGVSIEVIDSQNVTASQGFIALEAARMAAKGNKFQEVICRAEEVREKATFLLLLETIKHVYRTGRIPKIAAQVGSALNIKPILTNSKGKIKFLGAVQKKEKGIERIRDIVRKRVGGRPVHIAVMHAYAEDEAKKFMAQISQEFNCLELWLTEFSPVMGYACGTGSVGLAFYED